LKRQSVFREFFEFLMVRKKLWLLPIVIALLLLGGMIVFSESSAIATFIYAIF
jgi:hypothetical protein